MQDAFVYILILQLPNGTRPIEDDMNDKVSEKQEIEGKTEVDPRFNSFDGQILNSGEPGLRHGKYPSKKDERKFAHDVRGRFKDHYASFLPPLALVRHDSHRDFEVSVSAENV